MSARIINTIAEAIDDGPDPRTQVTELARYVIDYLRANGFALVELPKPTDTENHLTEMSMLGWEVGYGPAFVEALPGNPPTVRVEVDGENIIEVSPSYAAQFAAALLAAANAAEATR